MHLGSASLACISDRLGFFNVDLQSLTLARAVQIFEQL